MNRMTARPDTVTIRPVHALIAVVTCLLAAIAGPVLAQADTAAEASAPTVLITGGDRGLGLEFAKQYAERGWRVIATCRTPAEADALKQLADGHPNLIIDRLDITDHAAVDALAARYAYLTIDVLINNAALLGPRNTQMLRDMDYDLFRRVLEVNTIGSFKVTEAFTPHVIASRQKKIITLGSAAGSIQLIGPPPDFYAYRASKTALHLLMRNVALGLADDGVIVGLINPGLVDTRGFANIGPDDPVPEDFRQIVTLIRSGDLKLSTPAEAVDRMIALIDNLTAEQSGIFLNIDGQVLPW